MRSVFDGVYEGRRVLVTGHTGFKGSWLSLWLKECGATVLGYSLAPSTKPSLFEALCLDHKIQHTTADVRCQEQMMRAFHEFRPEIVFHLAAQPIVRKSYLEPRETYETNVMGTVNLYEAIRQVGGVRVVVTITSDKCYENQNWVYGYRETDPMGGYDPYSSSKGCAELITAAYRRSFFEKQGVALSSVRAGNVIGGGDWAEDRLVPDCIRALQAGIPVVIRNPRATRPWQYVLDALSGYLWLGSLMWKEPARYSGAWNFGPSDRDVWSVDRLVRLILSVWGSGTYSCGLSEGPHEASLLRLDTSKAQMLLGWSPLHSTEEAVESTVTWYKRYYAGNVMEEESRQYLADFAAKASRTGVVVGSVGPTGLRVEALTLGRSVEP